MGKKKKASVARPVTFTPVARIVGDGSDGAGKRKHTAHISRFHALNKRLALAKQVC